MLRKPQPDPASDAMQVCVRLIGELIEGSIFGPGSTPQTCISIFFQPMGKTLSETSQANETTQGVPRGA